MQEILSMWPCKLVSFHCLESFTISRFHIQMRSLQLFRLLIMIHNIFYWFLLVIAPSINGLLGECWLDYIEFAKMSAAIAILAAAIFLIVVVKVVIGEFLSSSYECDSFFLDGGVVSLHIIGG